MKAAMSLILGLTLPLSFLTIATGAPATCLDRDALMTLQSCDRIKLLVGVTAGGASDLIARDLAKFVSSETGSSVIVENKPGASGNIAAQILANSGPNDCIAMVGTSASLYLNVFNPNLRPKFDPQVHTKNIGLIATNPMFLVVNSKKVPASTVDGFANHFSNRTGTYATPGIGSSNHFVALRMDSKRRKSGAGGSEFVHVPTKGASEAMNLLLSGSVDFTFENPATAKMAVGSNKIAILGNTSNQKAKISGIEVEPLTANPILAGVTGYSAFGLIASKAMPEKMASAFESALQCFLKNPTLRNKYEQDGYTLMSGTPDEMSAWVDTEFKEWSTEAKDAYK